MRHVLYLAPPAEIILTAQPSKAGSGRSVSHLRSPRCQHDAYTRHSTLRTICTLGLPVPSERHDADPDPDEGSARRRPVEDDQRRVHVVRRRRCELFEDCARLLPTASILAEPSSIAAQVYSSAPDTSTRGAPTCTASLATFLNKPTICAGQPLTCSRPRTTIAGRRATNAPKLVRCNQEPDGWHVPAIASAASPHA